MPPDPLDAAAPARTGANAQQKLIELGGGIETDSRPPDRTADALERIATALERLAYHEFKDFWELLP